MPVKLAKDAADADLPATAVQVAGGGLHSLALFQDGAANSVYAWGSNSHGQLGFSPYSTGTYTPLKPNKVRLTEVVGKVEQIAAGNKFSLALEVVRDGLDNPTGQKLWGWGYGAAGQLKADPRNLAMLVANNTDTAYSYKPVLMFAGPLAGNVFITKIAAGLDHVLLLLSDGTVQTVGFNFYGQLGNDMNPVVVNGTSTSTAVSSFELVNTLNTDGTGNLTGATDIAAFGNHSLALVNGKWYGWGNNNMGQLGSPASSSSAGNPKRPRLVEGF